MEKADIVAYAGLEEVLGAKENVKVAPNSAFQRKSDRWAKTWRWVGVGQRKVTELGEVEVIEEETDNY